MDPQLAVILASAKRQANSYEATLETTSTSSSPIRKKQNPYQQQITQQAMLMREAAATTIPLRNVTTQKTSNIPSYRDNQSVLQPGEIETSMYSELETTAEDPELTLELLKEADSGGSSEQEELPTDEDSPLESDDQAHLDGILRQQVKDISMTLNQSLLSAAASEDGLFTDQSPTHSPTPPTSPFAVHTSSFQADPSDSVYSTRPSGFPIRQPKSSSPDRFIDKEQTIINFQDESISSHAEKSSLYNSFEYFKPNTSLLASDGIETGQFEDEPLPAPQDDKFECAPDEKQRRSIQRKLIPPSGTAISNWCWNQRYFLFLVLGIVCLIGIAIGVRYGLSDTPTYDTGPNLADTIIVIRNDDDEIDSDDKLLVNILSTVIPTRAPSVTPTIDYTGLSRSTLFFKILSLVSSEDDLVTTGTPENKAYLWLVDDDKGIKTDSDLSPEAFFEVVQERYIMALFYYSTNGGKWRNQYSFLSKENICNWNDGGTGVVTEGISCLPNLSREKGYEITELVFDMNSLGGNLPSEIGLLSSLSLLGLGSNSISGSIPSELGNLVELTWLGLAKNYFVGDLPSQLGSLTKLEGFLACKSCVS
jgi:hypothetical protein